MWKNNIYLGKPICSWQHHAIGIAQRPQEGSSVRSLWSRCFKGRTSIMEESFQNRRGIRTAPPRDFVPFLVVVGFDLLIIFKDGSRFLLILMCISKTSGLVVIYWTFAMQERYHKIFWSMLLKNSKRLGNGLVFFVNGLPLAWVKCESKEILRSK